MGYARTWTRGGLIAALLLAAGLAGWGAGEPKADELRRFDEAYAKADFARAERTLAELARDHPGHPAVELRGARLDRCSGRLDRAAATLTHLLYDDDTRFEVRRELAEVAFLRHDFGAAWSLFMEPHEHRNPPGEVLVWAGMINYLTLDSHGVAMISASLEVADDCQAYASAFALLAAFDRKEDACARRIARDFPALPEHPLKPQVEQFVGRARQFYAARHPEKWSDTGHPRPVFEVDWTSPNEIDVTAVRYRAHRILDPTASRDPWTTLWDRRSDAYARVSVHRYPEVSLVVHNQHYRHFGMNFTASGKRLHNAIDVEFSLQADGTLGLVVAGEPLVGKGTHRVVWAGIEEARASFEITSPSQDFPLESIWSDVTLVGGDGVATPVEVKTTLPALHAYRNGDDIGRVDLTLAVFIPRGNRIPGDWRRRMEYAAAQFQKMHFRLFEGRSLLSIHIVPEPVVGDFNHHFYSNLRYAELHDQVKREVCRKAGYAPGPGYPMLLVFADVRLEPYDPVANYGSGGMSWLHKGYSMVTREILMRAPDRPEVGEDEQAPWMGKRDRMVHASWPWAVAYHEFLHGLGCPHTFDEPDSIMGAGLFTGTARANLPESILRYMRGRDMPDEEVLTWARKKRAERAYAEALGYYGQALRAAPGDLALKYEEAQCLSEAGRHEDALARAQQLCRANPLDAVFAWFLGSEFYKLGRMEEARATFDQLLARHPGNAFAHSYLSYIYTYSKQHRNRDKALYHAEEALRLFDSEEGRADARRHLATIRSHDGPFKDQS